MTRLDVGRSIADSLAVFREHPVVLVPIMVAAAISTAFYHYLSSLELWAEPSLQYYILVYLAIPYVVCVLIRMVHDATRGQVSLAQAVKVPASKYLFFIVATILYGMAVGLGALALIIPGVFLGIKLCYYGVAIVIEDAGIIDSLKRSWQIVRGNWWRTFALFLRFILPILLLNLVAVLVPAPGGQIIYFAGSLGMYWFYVVLAIAFVQLTGGVSDSGNAGMVGTR